MAEPSRKGRLIVEGDHATLVFERLLPHAAEHVWEAIATPEGLREWLLAADVALEGRVGGRIEMISGPPRYRSTGRILAWDPPRVLEYEWNVAPVPEMPRGESALFRYELEARGDDTLLTVTYRRLTARSARGVLPGRHAFLARLEAQLGRRALPDWLTSFAAHRLEYSEWTAHAPPAGQ